MIVYLVDLASVSSGLTHLQHQCIHFWCVINFLRVTRFGVFDGTMRRQCLHGEYRSLFSWINGQIPGCTPGAGSDARAFGTQVCVTFTHVPKALLGENNIRTSGIHEIGRIRYWKCVDGGPGLALAGLASASALWPACPVPSGLCLD
jgi:hypothetical protein